MSNAKSYTELLELHGGSGKVRVCRPYGYDKRLPLHIEVLDFAPGQSEGQHVHREGIFEVYIVLEGQGEFTVDGSVEDICAGDIVRVEPGTWHGLRNTGDSMLRVSVIWGRFHPTQLPSWSAETFGRISSHVIRSWESRESLNEQTAWLITDLFPQAAFVCLQNGWPERSMFAYRADPTVQRTRNPRSLENIASIATDPRWKTGAADWLSVCKLFARSGVVQSLSKAALASIKETGVSEQLTLSVTLDLYSVLPGDVLNIEGADGKSVFLVNLSRNSNDIEFSHPSELKLKEFSLKENCGFVFNCKKNENLSFCYSDNNKFEGRLMILHYSF